MARMSFVVNANGCHTWQKARNNRGYGVVWHDGKLRLAHRVAWFLEFGQWPADGLVLDHICCVKSCVNAAHLREITNHSNLRRAIPRGDAETERRRAKWREADSRRRTYGPLYTVGGD